MNQEPRHCPYCELWFRLHHEVQDHVLHDHPDRAGVALTANVVELPPVG